MSTKVYGIKQKSEQGLMVNIFGEGREKIETVYVTATLDKEYMAVTEDGETFGYRHASIDLAIQKVAKVRDYAIVWVSASHPVARQFVGA